MNAVLIRTELRAPGAISCFSLIASQSSCSNHRQVWLPTPYPGKKISLQSPLRRRHDSQVTWLWPTALGRLALALGLVQQHAAGHGYVQALDAAHLRQAHQKIAVAASQFAQALALAA